MFKAFLASFIFFYIASCTALNISDFPIVSFQEGMAYNYNFLESFASKDAQWAHVKGLFETYTHTLTVSKEPRIPKIIHIIWLGSPLPLRCAKLIKTWRKKHKDWEFKIWRDKDVQPFGLQNQALFNKAVNWGEKSDIFRYEILYRHGGLYVDTDFECLRSFDILHHTCDFYTGIAYNSTALLYNGLIGVAPGHPIMKACMDNIKMEGDPRDFDAIMQRTGPDYFTRMFFKALPDCPKNSVVTLPTSYFYPFPPRLRFRALDKQLVNKFTRWESFCVHYFAASWAK